MEHELANILADTQDRNEERRKRAELQLRSLYSNEAFPLTLTSIAYNNAAPVNIRQSALSTLRTFIVAAWSPQFEEFKGQVLVSDANKAQLRRVLLELATTAQINERKVRASASYVVSKIASVDFPDQWPDLLSSLLQIIPAGDDIQIHGALRVLADLVETGFSEDQFFSIARDLVSTLHTVATNESRKPMLRALAMSVFRSCFDTLEMVMEDHKAAVRQFMGEALQSWLPFFLNTLKFRLPSAPSEEEENHEQGVTSEWRGMIALKLQVVKTLMKIRSVFPTILTPHSPALFSATWDELTSLRDQYHTLFINDERQGRLEDADNLPYTLDFLVLEELDFMQNLLRAPPVKAELEGQVKASPNQPQSAGWLQEMMKLVVSFAQISMEEEGMWDIDVNLFLSEETSVTANYTPRTACGEILIKLGEWLNLVAVQGLLEYTSALFPAPDATWKSREASLYLLGQVLSDFADVDQKISLDVANGYDEYVRASIRSEDVFLRARGYLVTGIITKTTDDGYHPVALSYMETSLKAVVEDPSEVVKVSCIRVLGDFLKALPPPTTKALQSPVINAISDFVTSHDLRELTDSDDLKVVLVETLRDTIMVDPSIVISSNAIDMLFSIASNGASNFQITALVTECFEEIVSSVATDHDAYVRLCEKVLPALTGAFDVGDMTQEDALVNLAAELVAALAEHGSEPLPNGFVAAVMPKLNRVLLNATAAELLRPATLAVKYTLAHGHSQFFEWHDPQTSKGAVEVLLVIIARLLGPTVDDHAASEVGGLAAEVVEKAGAEKLGPYLLQLLSAVAIRLASAQEAQFVQSLISVFGRLSLASPKDVVDFLSQVDVDGENGLAVVVGKWLENSVNFAGYDEIRQNVIALTELYHLDDPRLSQVMVKGDLITPATGRIKTRSQARQDPDQYTVIPAPLKIIKLLVEELSSASTARWDRTGAAAAAAAGLESEGSDDDEWEDEPGGVLDLGLGVTKQDLMAFGADDGPGPRQRDDATHAFLLGFFRGVAQRPGFAAQFAALTPAEQETLRSLGQEQQ